MSFAIKCWRTTTGFLEELVETAQALKSRGSPDFNDWFVGGDEEPLGVRQAVLLEKLYHRRTERFAEQCHRVVRMETHSMRDLVRRQRLHVVARDVAGKLVCAA